VRTTARRLTVFSVTAQDTYWNPTSGYELVTVEVEARGADGSTLTFPCPPDQAPEPGATLTITVG
jgi:hypothetical protein